MPASISSAAEGLRLALATIPGLRTFAYQPEQIQPPVGYVLLERVEFHRAMSGGNVVQQWQVGVITGRWTDQRAHAALDGYLSFSGASSVRAAIEADKTLGGRISTLIVAAGASIAPLSVADAEFLQVQFSVTVHS